MTNVKEMYTALLKSGYSPKDAAKEAQVRTGQSAVTGRKIKSPGNKNKPKRKWLYGEYDT